MHGLYRAIDTSDEEKGVFPETMDFPAAAGLEDTSAGDRESVDIELMTDGFASASQAAALTSAVH